MKTVGIIGGGGYIGSYVTRKFLENGYRVRVSATDISRKDKYAHLSQLGHAENMELLPLDVLNKEQLQAFTSGCEIIVHGGTPFQLEVADPIRAIFDPTVKGTKNFLEVAVQSRALEKVVFIASVASLNTNFPLLPDGKMEGDQVSEADEPFISEESHPYAQAKFVAHRTVDKFMAEHTHLGFEITTVSPVGVMGKSLSQREDSTSMGIQHLFKHQLAPNPFIRMFYDLDVDWAVVDVEDVAEGVYRAAIRRGIHGRNYLLASESYPVSDISLMLNQQEPINQPKIVYSNELACRELGMTFRPTRRTLMSYSASQQMYFHIKF